MGIQNNENVGIAFALVIAAGASTALGASVVFFPALVSLASRKTLAAGLGLSAGVMSYVSFVEIFQKSVGAFEDAGYEDNKAYIYATLCFFGGVVLMVLLNILVHNLLGYHHSHHSHGDKKPNTQETMNSGSDNEQQKEKEPQGDDKAATGDDGPLPPCCAHDPVEQMENIQHMAHEMENRRHLQVQEKEQEEEKTEIDVAATTTHAPHPPDCECIETGEDGGDAATKDDDNDNDRDTDAEEKEKLRLSKLEAKKLAQMSLNTAVAIALHNFPEGLATFVAALNDPKVGAVLAIAIAIHNIPEGLCVAMPVYYATGNRCRAFLWACMSGVSEPIAALLGYIVLANSFSDTLYAVLFGMVGGMMVIISVRELLPTAHRYDPEDAVVTTAFIVGMGIMALSLALFLL